MDFFTKRKREKEIKLRMKKVERVEKVERVGLELFLICGFGANFCFNSKPSFSFESIEQ